MNFKSLVSEDGTNASMGRFTFWILLIICICFWSLKPPKDFPDTLYYLTLYSLLYNYGKKLVPLSAFLNAKSPKDLTTELTDTIKKATKKPADAGASK